MSRAPIFNWTAEAVAEARRRYVDDLVGPAAVAAELGCAAHHLKWLIRREGWGALRGPGAAAAMQRTRWAGVKAAAAKAPATDRPPPRGFIWTDARVALLEQLYLEEGLSPEAIAPLIGGGCTPRKVSRRCSNSGLVARRDPAMAAAQAAAVRARANAAKAAKAAGAPRPAAGPPPPVRGFSRRPADMAPPMTPEAERAAVAAALAAGKLTILPSGRAAGLSACERQFWAAPPPLRDSERLRLAARRGGVKSSRGGGR